MTEKGKREFLVDKETVRRLKPGEKYDGEGMIGEVFMMCASCRRLFSIDREGQCPDCGGELRRYNLIFND